MRSLLSTKLSLSRINDYLALMRIDKPIGIYLVTWPALWALVLAAKGMPDLTLLMAFIIGAFLMRSAGCVINDYADRNIDGKVKRTSNRPLVIKSITNGEALQLFFLLIGCSAILLLLTNQLTFLLALGAAALTCIYPFMKRYTHLPQVVLGMAFSGAVPMAFAAQTNQLPPACWTLYFAVVIWVIFYDTFYAMVDREDDLKIGVRSTAILFGCYDKLITAILQIIFIVFLIVVGMQTSSGLSYFIGCGLALILLLHQQWLIRHREKTACFRAFLNNNYVGLVIFLGICADAIINTKLVG